MKYISEQRLVSALSTTAQLIQAYGDDYWPIFDRLERELNFLRERNTKLKKYQSIKDHLHRISSSNLYQENFND